MTEENTEYPQGNAQNPVNNLDEALAIVDERLIIEIDDDLLDPLIRLYVLEHLSKESNLVFVESLYDGAELNDALASAVINEMANYALKEQIEREEAKAEQCITTKNI